MTVDVLRQPTRADRRARAAVAVLFLTNGALFANLLPRYPQIKDDLGIGNAVYGLAVAAFPAGAVVAGPAAGVLARRLGSARVAVLGTLLTGAGTLAAGLARLGGPVRGGAVPRGGHGRGHGRRAERPRSAGAAALRTQQLTIVSWLMRLGFLCSPPLVGLVADTAGLRVGLLVVPPAGPLVIPPARPRGPGDPECPATSSPPVRTRCRCSAAGTGRPPGSGRSPGRLRRRCSPSARRRVP